MPCGVWRIDDFIVSNSDPEAILLLSSLDEIEPWTAVDVSGDDEWSVFFLEGREAVAIDGTFAQVPNYDWIISPPINIGDAEIPVLNFDYYTEAAGPHGAVLVSNDYDAAVHTDTITTTWAPVTVDLTTASSGGWTSYSGISLFGISGEKVHVGFQYTNIGGEFPVGRLIAFSNVCVFKVAGAPPLTAGLTALPIQPNDLGRRSVHSSAIWWKTSLHLRLGLW
ncbi:MAG: hypothetical protein ACI8T1_004611 [Verrucomicrobiales bacterium]